MENEPLGIKDHDKSTEGGPPGWLAFAAVFLAFLVVVAFMLIAWLVWWT